MPAVVFLCGHQLGEAAVPVVVGALIDDAIARGDALRLAGWLVVLAVDFAVLSLCWRFGARFAAAGRLGIEHRLRMLVVLRALDPRGMQSPRRAGELITLAASDARRVSTSVRTIIGAAAGLVVLVASVIVIAATSWLLATLVVVAACLVLLVVSRLSALVERRSHAEQQAGADAAASASDLVAGLRVLAGLRAGAAAAARYRRISAEAKRHSVSAADAQGLVDGVTALATGLYLVAVAAVGTALALNGAATIGDVIAVFGLSQFILGPLSAVAAAWPAYGRGAASAARIQSLLDAPAVTVHRDDAPAEASGADDTAGGSSLLVTGLTVAGLRGVDLDVAPGTLHGIAVASADDADALVAVLGGERAAEAGAVVVGGIALRELHVDERRRRLLVWPHGALPPGRDLGELLTGRRGDAGPLPDDIRSLFTATAVDDVIERRPAGLDAPVAEGGASLSGGEAQRVALARLLGEGAPVLVLHEPTSALDAVTEREIAAALRRLRHGRTTVLVTTSAALLAACDTVTLLDRTVVASASPAELADSDGYRTLVER